MCASSDSAVQLIISCCCVIQDEIPYKPRDQDEVVMMTRKAITEADGKWSTNKQRVSELNIMYRYIDAEAVRLSSEKGKLLSVKQAVQELVTVLKIGQKPPAGMTIAGFRNRACRWNKEQRAAARAAVADATASADGDAADGDIDQA